ncbi:unnamed protein product, partial [Symbiodinium microadriaticum]
EAKELLKNLERLQLQQDEMITPPPRDDVDDDVEAKEPPSKRAKLRKKRSKETVRAEDDGLGKEKATPEKQKPKPSKRKPLRSPPLSGGATSSGHDPVQDQGEDAQPSFPSDSLPTPFKSTQKQLTPQETPRKSLLCSFEKVSDPPADVHVLSLAPAPEMASESDDEMLQHALKNMVEVSSAEENWFCVLHTHLLDKDDVYGTPLKAATTLAKLSKSEEAKLEAILRRLCKADKKGNYQEGFLQKVNHTYRQNRSNEFKVRSGFYTDQMMADELKFTISISRDIAMLFASSHHPSTTDCYLRKDKYQKKLIWYWCDIAYEGTQANRDEEELLRDTAISDGARVSDVAFGLGGSLPDLNSEDDNDNDGDDDEDEDEEEDEEADEPKAKLGKRKSKESLPDDVEEDMDGVPGLLNEDLESFQKLITELGAKHDELADMKSNYDCEEPVDGAKLTKLINTANKKASRITMEENKIKKSFIFEKPPGDWSYRIGCDECPCERCASVPHELLAELANAVVSEVNESFGEEASTKQQSSSLLRKMSHGFTVGHAAQKTREALDAMPENQAPLEVTEVDIGLGEPFPCILFSSYLRALGEHNKLSILTRDVNLQSFWDKMQPLLPRHPIFQLPAEARDRTIPLYLIGDEGRGWKKSAVFVLGSESLLGTGCDAEDQDTATQDMKMNFRGNTMVTRQLFACMPKNLYLNDDRPLHKLVDIWAEDFAKLFYHGLDIRCGHSIETWRMMLRDFGLTGCSAKGLDRNLAHLYGEMKAFAADRDLYLHMNALTKGMLGISSAADYPTGQWFKGADTTFVIKFLVFKFETVLPTAETDLPFLQTVLECLKASDGFLSSLYKAGLFLQRRRLVKIVRLGLEMVSAYTRCAALALSRSLARFKLTPKYHMLMHVIYQLQLDRDAHRTPLNPLAYSCQMPEDFINRIATLARSVSPRYVPARSLYLYKVALARAWA